MKKIRDILLFVKNRSIYLWDIKICKKHLLKTIPAVKVKNEHIEKLSRVPESKNLISRPSRPNMIRNIKTGVVTIFHGNIDDFRKSRYNNEQYELVESAIK